MIECNLEQLERHPKEKDLPKNRVNMVELFLGRSFSLGSFRQQHILHIYCYLMILRYEGCVVGENTNRRLGRFYNSGTWQLRCDVKAKL